MTRRAALAALGGLLILAGVRPALAAEALDGATMGWPWAVPFLGVLLSIALGPLLFAKVWHRHYGKIGAGWALFALAAVAVSYGVEAAAAAGRMLFGDAPVRFPLTVAVVDDYAQAK